MMKQLWARLRVSLSWKLLAVVLLSLGSGILTFALLIPLLRTQINQEKARLHTLRRTYQHVDAALHALPLQPLADAGARRALVTHLQTLLRTDSGSQYLTQAVYLTDLDGRCWYDSAPNQPTSRPNLRAALRLKLQPTNIIEPEQDSLLFFPVRFTDASGYLLVGTSYPTHFGQALDRYYWKLGAAYAVAALVFCGMFLLLQRPRVRYLRQLARQVQELPASQFTGQVTEAGRDELGAVAHSINDMARQLARRIAEDRRNEQARYELITSLSHDLKSPLTSILGYLDLLQTHPGLRSDDTSQHYVLTAHRNARLLHARINRLFEYSQLSTLSEAELLHPVDTNVATLLRQMAGDFMPLFERRGIAIDLTIEADPVMLCIDHHYWVRALENLFENAVRYAAPDSVFTVHLTRQSNQVVLLLANETEREATAEAERLFDRFYRGEAARRSEGSGLGLAITRRILELHHSTIRGRTRVGTKNNAKEIRPAVLPSWRGCATGAFRRRQCLRAS